jgi:7,8-dihydro-6-hydroxymethylpterin dimethyltransferase
VLREDGKLIATTHFDFAIQPSAEEAAAKSMEYVRQHWKYYADSEKPLPDGSPRDSEGLFERIRSHALCISGMAFQDAWNIDLERLQRCCIHVVTEQEKLIPFCAYYLTDSSGRRLMGANGRERFLHGSDGVSPA